MTSRPVFLASQTRLVSRLASTRNAGKARGPGPDGESTALKSKAREASIHHPGGLKNPQETHAGGLGPRKKSLPTASGLKPPLSLASKSSAGPGDDWQRLPAPLKEVADKAAEFLSSHVDTLFKESMKGTFTFESARVLAGQLQKLEKIVDAALKLFRMQCSSLGKEGELRAGERLLKSKLLSIQETAHAEFDLLDFRDPASKMQNTLGKTIPRINQSHDTEELARLKEKCQSLLAEHEQKKLRVATLVSRHPELSNLGHRQELAQQADFTEALLMASLGTVHRYADRIAVSDATDELEKFSADPIDEKAVESVFQKHRSAMEVSNRNVAELKSLLEKFVVKIQASAERSSVLASQRDFGKAWVNSELMGSSVEKFSLATKMLRLLTDLHAPALAKQVKDFEEPLESLVSDLLDAHDLQTVNQLDAPVALEVHRHAHRVTTDLRDDFQGLSSTVLDAVRGTPQEARFAEVLQGMKDCIGFALLTQEENISGKKKALMGSEPGADVQRRARGVIEANFKTLTRGAFEPVWTDDEMQAALRVTPQKSPKPAPKAGAAAAAPRATEAADSAWVHEASRFNLAFTDEKEKQTQDIARGARAMPKSAREAVKGPLKGMPNIAWFAKQFGTATVGLKKHLEGLQQDRQRILDLIPDASTRDGFDPDQTRVLNALKGALPLIDKNIHTACLELQALQDECSLLISARQTRIFLEDTDKRIEVLGGLIDSGVIKAGQRRSSRYPVRISNDFGEQFELTVRLDRKLSAAMGRAVRKGDNRPQTVTYLHHFHFATPRSQRPTGSSIKPESQKYGVGPAVDRSSTYFPDIMEKEYGMLRDAVNAA